MKKYKIIKFNKKLNKGSLSKLMIHIQELIFLNYLHNQYKVNMI